jgi:hypothetical protein
MTAPSQYLRDLREEQTSRRLGVAKALRETPDATNIELAKVFGVSRNTIAEDRVAIMEQMTKSTLTETELLRAEMVTKLEALEAEVQKHRKDGKLSLSAIDQLLSITKAVIELTGVRKAVVEKVDVKHRAPIRFLTTIVGTGGDPNAGISYGANVKPKHVIEIREPLALGAGDEGR